MNGDVPFALYSFEHEAILEGRLTIFARADISGTFLAPGNVLNFGGHRFLILDFERFAVVDVTLEQISDIGFSRATPEEEREAFENWVRDIGDQAHIFLYRVQPLEQESNEPLT